MFHYEETKISQMQITLERYESLISNDIRKKLNPVHVENSKNDLIISQSVLNPLARDSSALKQLTERANHVQRTCQTTPNLILQSYQPLYSSFRKIKNEIF